MSESEDELNKSQDLDFLLRTTEKCDIQAECPVITNIESETENVQLDNTSQTHFPITTNIESEAENVQVDNTSQTHFPITTNVESETEKVLNLTHIMSDQSIWSLCCKGYGKLRY